MDFFFTTGNNLISNHFFPNFQTDTVKNYEWEKEPAQCIAAVKALSDDWTNHTYILAGQSRQTKFADIKGVW